jgi:cardiolipin synthase (CMP-forming)
VMLLLTLQDWLPWWFTLAAVARDVLIVGGALAYHVLIGNLDVAPSRLSKLNTALEFLLLASTLAIAAGHVDAHAWWDVLVLTTLATVVLSGAHYVLVWGRKAARARRHGVPSQLP